MPFATQSTRRGRDLLRALLLLLLLRVRLADETVWITGAPRRSDPWWCKSSM